MTQTAVPTIRDTVTSTLQAAGIGSYSQYQPYIERIVTALEQREQVLLGTGQPVTDEILRRLDPEAPEEEVDDLPIPERLSRLETEVMNLIGFARDNGYRL